ncbi:MAG: malectin domain-containing carbohydrate-binding protein [Microscillaceae bacterium]|nr:malectin domain-containing carbohydrate-binding protein [Microscillaceae bacterium]
MLIIQNKTAHLHPPTSNRWLRWRNLCSGLLVFWLSIHWVQSQNIAFNLKTLNFNGNGSISSSTSLEFGPDNRLYVSEVDGDIKVFTIQRNEGTGAYQVTASQTITLVKSIPNHNDDGTLNTGVNSREVTGLTVAGTAANPVIYVTSSDSRVGAGGGGGDTNLDTNSGVITRLTWNGNAWVAVDLVRGLPRSEENHATNGLEFITVNGTKYLIVCSGGFTNAGAPSNNFAYITEYALSGAVLSVNLTMLESMPILTDAASGRSYVYDLPTLDDPTRANANGITDPNTAGYNGVDVNDPWGGNDGLNMAKLVVGSPVQMFSPGYRNTYDLVITENGGVYVTDNGANGGWGGYPEYEANPNLVSNIFRVGEPGSSGPDSGPNNSPFDPQVNNDDHLNLVTTNIQNYTFGSVYGGHPCPVRANPNAGLYTRGTHSDASANYFTATAFTDDAFRTQLYDPDGSTPNSSTDPESALPANWPPVDAALFFAPNADFRQPDLSGNANPDGDEDIIIATWQNNTNGIDEYTASNFGGQMQGNLIAGQSGGNLHRVILGNNGTTATVEQNKFSTSGGNPLGITCQGDADIFPGTIWAATFDSRIVVLEPNDFVICINPGEPGYSPTADNDNDGFINQDEIDNNTDLCNGGNFPTDNDGDNVSDLNDTDDDNDGTLDANDPFQLYNYTQNANALAEATLPINNELFSQQLDGNGKVVGYLGLGLTGLMNNGTANPNYQNWLDDPTASNADTDDIYGGAIGAMTIYHTTGDALGNQNDQEKAFQMAAKVGTSTGMFEVSAAMFPPFHNWSNTESQGLFIGTGDQDNYIKLVLTSDGSEKIVQVVSENNGTANVGAFSPITIPANVNSIELYFMVNPANGSVQPQFSINGGAKTNVGSPFNAIGSVLNAIQNDNTLLAVGIIGTADSDDNFASNWDFIKVEGNAPFITNALPDVEAFVNDPAQNINLDNFFDDNGTLTYAIQSNSNNAVGASILGNILTLTFPSNPATSNITVRATDGENLFVEQTFTVTVTNEPQVLFRINAGDNDSYTDPQGNLWSADQYSVSGNPYPASQNPVGTAIANTDKDFIYQTERSGSSGWQYQIPISQPGTYRINLHFAEIYFGLPGGGSGGGVGSRVFDVIVEGQTLLDNYDIIADVGTATAVVKTFDVTVNDGTLNIVGTASVNQAKISAIEVFSLGANPPTEIPINVTSISNQTNLEGTAINLQVAATGGDGALSYAATGLPTGLSISNTTGLISGTISTGAATNSPYAVTVTVNDADGNNADAQTVNFQWTVTAPVVADCADIANANQDNDGQINSVDTDDDNDGILDVNDAFALDANNGTTTNLPLVLNFDQKIDNSLLCSGFTGMMTNGTANYLSQFNPNNIIVDNTAGTLTINLTTGTGNIDGGDAFGTQNNQSNGFQTGIVVPNVPFTVHTRIQNPFPNSDPQINSFQAVGLQLGQGNQANYMKFVIGVQNATTVRAQRAIETNNVTSGSEQNQVNTSAIRASNLIDLYIDIDPATGLATPRYELDGIPVSFTWTSVNISSFIQNGVLAVGIISSASSGAATATDGSPFTAVWELFEVTGPEPSCAGTALPGLLEAESFTAKSTDIQTEGTAPGLVNIGFIKDASFVDYSVCVDESGCYALSAQAAVNTAAGASGGTITVLSGNQTIGYLAIQGDTGGWQTYQSFTGSVNLTAGDNQTIRFLFNKPAGVAGDPFLFNLNNYTFTKINNDVPVLTITSPSQNPATFSSEDVVIFTATANDAQDGNIASSISWSSNVDGSLGTGSTISTANLSIATHTITATVTDGCGITSTTTTSVVIDPIVGVTLPLCINAGGDAINAFGKSFVADNYFLNGQTFGSVSSANAIGGTVISSPEEDLLQTERFNTNLQYAIPTGNGTFAVELYLSELYVGAPGGGANEGAGFRVFDIELEGNVVETGLDLFSQFGALNGVIKNYQVTVTDGVLNISFPASANNGKISALCISDAATFVPNQTPTVDIADFTSVLDCGANGEEVTLTATATDPEQGDLSSLIKWTSNGNLLGTGASLTTTVSNGQIVTASITDAVPLTDSDELNIALIQNTSPTIVIATPPNGSSFTQGENINLTASANDTEDGDLSANIQWTDGVGGPSLGTGASINVSNLSVGVHNIIATVADQCNASIIDEITITINPAAIGLPQALLEITPGGGFGATTFGTSTIQIFNQSTLGLQITQVKIDVSTGIFPDMVWDPVGNGGDATAQCLNLNASSTSAANLGLTVPGDGGTELADADCSTPFSMERNGGYDVVTLNFTNFDPNEQLIGGIDVDPNSIKDIPGAGGSGAVSGLELSGATVTITFSDGTILTGSLYQDGSNGGGQVLLTGASQPTAPSIALQGFAGQNVEVGAANQVLTITGTPNAYFSVLQLGTNFTPANAIIPAVSSVQNADFYANLADQKVLYSGQ